MRDGGFHLNSAPNLSNLWGPLLTRLQGTQVVSGAHLIIPSAKFHNEGSTRVNPANPFTLIPMSGGNGGDGGVIGVVPNLYFSWQGNNKFWLGLGINAPFGLSTEYDKNWAGRYHGVLSEMMTININPSVALKLNERLSVGAGLNVQYLKAKLSNAIDFALIDTLKFGGFFNGFYGGVSDGFVKLKGDSFGFGYNFGALYEFTPATRVGFAYRSRLHQAVEGDAKFSGQLANNTLVPGPSFKNSDVTASVNLPASASISFVHQINPQWEIMGDVTWTQWSLFKELRFKFENGQADGVTTEKWKDTYRYSGGVTYKPGNWKFRAGIAYDTTAIRSDEYRTPRIPDANRLWLAGGLGYKISDRMQMDLGYVHLFVDDGKINKSPTGEDLVRGGLKGKYDANVNIISAQIKFAF